MQTGGTAADANDGFRAVLHRRICQVEPQYGCLNVTVVLGGITADRLKQNERVVLASIAPPYCDIDFDKSYRIVNAEIGELEKLYKLAGSERDTAVYEVRRGRVRLYCMQPDARLHGLGITWSFRVTGAFPYLWADHCYPVPNSYWQRPEDKAPARSHVLRIDSDRFELVYSLPPGCEIGGALVDVSEPDAFDLRATWEPAQQPLAEPAPRLLPDGDTAYVLELDDGQPRLGFRYAMAVKPADYPLRERKLEVFDAAKKFMRQIVRKVRGELYGEAPLVDALSKKLTSYLHEFRSDVFAGKASDEDSKHGTLAAVGMLWSPDDGDLRACYGLCSLEELTYRFPYAVGVAGHALRFNKAAISEPRPDPASHVATLLCSEVERERDWILCLPIGFDLTLDGAGDNRGIPIGVVWIAGSADTQHGTTEDAILSSLSHEKWLADLLWRTSMAFWEALALSERFLAQAQHTIASANYHRLRDSRKQSGRPPPPLVGSVRHEDLERALTALLSKVVELLQEPALRELQRFAGDIMAVQFGAGDATEILKELTSKVGTLEKRTSALSSDLKEVKDDSWVRDAVKPIQPTLAKYLDEATSDEAVKFVIKKLFSLI